MIEQCLNGSHTTYYNAELGEVKNKKNATLLTDTEADWLRASLTNDFQDAFIIDAPKSNHFNQLANLLRPANITPSKSVIDGKNGTIGGLSALAESLQRGRALIASGNQLIETPQHITHHNPGRIRNASRPEKTYRLL